jgi:hypothetical protein
MFQLGMLHTLNSFHARQDGPLTASAIVRLSIFFFLTTIVGIGLLFLRKWAALLLLAALMAFAIWLIVGSILYVPFPWNLINFIFAFVALLPTYVIFRSWSLMSWGGRWFF